MKNAEIYDTGRGWKGGGSFLIIYSQRSIGNNEINCDNTCKPDATVNGWNSFSK